VTTPQSEGVTTRVIRDEAGWDAIRRDWDDLYAASPYASTPLDFVWLRGWWGVYGPTYGSGGLRVVTVWRGPRLVGALPLYMRRGRGGPLGVCQLRFISTGEAEDEEICPDYMNLLCLSGEEDTCVDSVWAEVSQMAWDRLELLDLPEDSPLLRSRMLPQNAEPFARGRCPVADLTGGFVAYVDRLSSNSRQQARRLLREGERAGAMFEVVGVDQVGRAFDDLVRLHQERWTANGRPGVFAAPRFAEFHRNLIREWLPGARAVLARLSLEGEAVAVLYGFVTGEKFDFYQSGVRREAAGSLRSPGNLAHLLLMRALSDRGVTAYDFLQRSASNKERLATRENRLVGLQIWRPTLRAAIYRSARLAERVVTGLGGS
jgi:CelD/BcsL family acetyltransferase involved in cellulose biosynthesis